MYGSKGLWPGRLAIILIAATTALGWGTGVQAGVLSPQDKRLAKAAFRSAESGNWAVAQRISGRLEDPLAGKIIRWLRMTRANSGVRLSKIAGFIIDNPQWPGLDRLRRRLEEGMTAKTPDQAVLSWFLDNPPITTDGRIRYGAALLATGRKEEGREAVREAWLLGNFGKRQERAFYKRYRRLLTYGDHLKRLDRLLWEGRNWPVRRMLGKLKPADRALGEARLLLGRRQGNVDRAIARVPERLRNHPGLIYERLRWRRRKGRDASAMELLVKPPDDLLRPDKWWTERAILARRALKKGHVSEAYRIVKDHRLAEGAEFAEAEWLAGWIALRFLDDPEIAKGHFVRMFEAVKYPVSRARGAYWAARAAETMKDAKEADLWYRIAAKRPTVYYGQLAEARLRPGRGIRLPPDPQPGPALTKAFMEHELSRAMRILSEAGSKGYLRQFAIALSSAGKSPEWRALSGRLARAIGRPDLAIAVAKKSSREGRVLIQAGYPALIPPRVSSGPDPYPVEVPLVLAMIRQESAYYPEAVSHAGARGMMQLLPRTAYRVARNNKLPYSKSRLTSDADYNLILGQIYLAGLIKEFKGSYIMALAAYNAGPSRVRKWARNNGDPRGKDVDAIDWVEMIPFEETRNYVQRVLENLQVYRLRLADTEVAQNLEGDLER